MERNPNVLHLDRDQLRDVTLDDEALMREILSALIDDTSRQMRLLESAILEQDARRCAPPPVPCSAGVPRLDAGRTLPFKS